MENVQQGSKMIFAQMAKVMSEIGAIGKERENPQQKYKFRGIDDVYNAVHAALVKNKILCVPQMLKAEYSNYPSRTGGLLFVTHLEMEYMFVAEDGSSVRVVVPGEAMDYSDKATNKAMSAAQKYAFFQTFCIPTEEPKDSEYENPQAAAQKKPAQIQKPQPSQQRQPSEPPSQNIPMH